MTSCGSVQIDLSLGIPKSVLFHDQNYAPQAQLDSVYKRVQFESVSLLKVSTMVRYGEFFWAAHHSSMEIMCGSNTLWGFHASILEHMPSYFAALSFFGIQQLQQLMSGLLWEVACEPLRGVRLHLSSQEEEAVVTSFGAPKPGFKARQSMNPHGSLQLQ